MTRTSAGEPPAGMGTRHVGLATIAEAVDELARGRMVIVVDAADRENEGDLVMAAEHVTAEAVNFMATHARGLICVPMLRDRLDELGIGPMTTSSSDVHGTAFHVGVDHRTSSTGISAADRAAAIQSLADPASSAKDFTQPGHVFPLSAVPGGVLERPGHTEAAVDLAVAAGATSAAVICEIASADGSMARLPELLEFAVQHGLLCVSIEDLVEKRRADRTTPRRVAETRLPSGGRGFRAVGYLADDGQEHMALVLGDLTGQPPLVRLHSECLTGDVLASQRCDCGAQLQRAKMLIAEEGRGVLVYLRGHEGRGIGLTEKLRAYELQDDGLDTYEANLVLGHASDAREYRAGAAILSDLGVTQVRLLSNNPHKATDLERHGIQVLESIPLVTDPTLDNVRYLQTKQFRMGHRLGLGQSDTTPAAACQLAEWGAERPDIS